MSSSVVWEGIPQTMRYGRSVSALADAGWRVRRRLLSESSRSQLESARMASHCEDKLAISCEDPAMVNHQFPWEQFEKVMEKDLGSKS